MDDVNDSKLMEYIGLLSAEEFKDLGKWLKSPLTKNNKRLIQFYQLIKRKFPDLESSDLRKVQLFRKLYPNKKYNNKTFNNLSSEFTKQVTAFLAYHRLQKDNNLQQELLRKELLERQHIHFFETISTQLIESIQDKKAKSAVDYLQLQQIYHDLYFQPSEHRRYQQKTKELEVASENLENYFLLKKYQYLLEQSSRANIIHEKQPIKKEELQLLTNLRKVGSLAALDLYSYRLHENTKTSWANYWQFYEMYQKAFDSLPFSLQQDFLFCCINDLVVLSSSGLTEDNKALFNLYKFGLDNDFLLQNNTITGITFNNIILTACHVNNYDFAHKFIQDYAAKLPEKIAEEALIWANAQMDCVMGNYHRCTEHLKDWKPNHPMYVIQAKITLLKANYKWLLADKTQINRFQDYCLAFEKYIQRDEFYTNQKSTAFLNFIRFTKKLALFNLGEANLKGYIPLLDMIRNETNLFGKIWLLKEVSIIETK